MKQSTRDDEVVGTFPYYILKKIDLADLKTRCLQVPDITEIDVARNYMTSRGQALSQSLRDRSVATAEFQAASTWRHSQPGNVSELNGIQQL
jgi:hypothetical protein